MAKLKDFSQGINAILGDPVHPVTKSLDTGNEASQKEQVIAIPKPRIEEQPEPEGPEVRATLVISADLLEKTRALAYWERRSIKEVITEALTAYMAGQDEGHIDTAVKEYKISRKS